MTLEQITQKLKAAGCKVTLKGTKNDKLKTGDIPMIGVSAQCRLFIGWTAPDLADCAPDVVEGYHVADYFDAQGRYKGPDQHGVEPTFREMTAEEIEAAI